MYPFRGSVLSIKFRHRLNMKLLPLMTLLLKLKLLLLTRRSLLLLLQVSSDGGQRFDSRSDEADDDVVENLEDGDEAAAHRQAEDTTDVGHEPDQRDFLISFDLERW